MVCAAGIGKSRLVREVAAIAEARGVDVSWTFCDSIASDIPLHTISRLLRTAVGVGELNEAAARAQVRTQFPSADPDDLRLLDDLLGNASPDVTPIHIDPDARRRRLTALVNGASLARTAPAVFIIEDAQWIDDVSEALLAEFLSVLPQTPTMVVITYRPDYRGALTRAADAQAVALAPLSNSATTALITELLGRDPSVAELTSTVAHRASGNPFFAEEIIRDLIERDVLVGDRGDYVCQCECRRAQRACDVAGCHRRPHRPPGTDGQEVCERRVRDRVAIRHRLPDRVAGRAGPCRSGQGRADRSGERQSHGPSTRFITR